MTHNLLIICFSGFYPFLAIQAAAAKQHFLLIEQRERTIEGLRVELNQLRRELEEKNRIIEDLRRNQSSPFNVGPPQNRNPFGSQVPDPIQVKICQ